MKLISPWIVYYISGYLGQPHSGSIASARVQSIEIFVYEVYF